MAEKVDNGALRHPESASDEEKAGAVHDQLADEAPRAYTGDLPPDPDAHLSPEERAEIASYLSANVSGQR